MRCLNIVLFSACAALSFSAFAQTMAPPVVSPKPGQILASGTVPDEASKVGILTRLRDVYGTENVIDQIAVGTVVLPANWNTYVNRLINPNLKQVSRGQLKVDGNTVSIRGEVANEAQRQQIASDMATNLNSTYTVNNGLRVSASEQTQLDSTLGNRIVEFETGKASLTQRGKAILDELTVILIKLKKKKLEIIGHTDDQGIRSSNILLSNARAETVKSYLTDKGLNADLIGTSGQGPDRPVAGNDSSEGRARNRRIEFRIAQ